MTAKFTPGPWVEMHDSPGKLYANRVDLICDCQDNENDADVRLIAEAPAMYEALRDLLSLYSMDNQAKARAILKRVEEGTP